MPDSASPSTPTYSADSSHPTVPVNTVFSGAESGTSSNPQFRAIETEVAKDFSPAVAAAKQTANTVLNDAKTGVEGLIDIAAGDAQRVITAAEAQAIPLALGVIPKPISGIVEPFAAAAIKKAEGPINHTITSDITIGLGLAHTWLETLIANAQGFVAKIGKH